jgi:hypothetical protein
MSPFTAVRGKISFTLKHKWPCVIFFTSWPAWLYVCQTFFLECIEIYATDLSHPWCAKAQHLFQDVHWNTISLPCLQQSLLHTSTGMIVLVSATDTFLHLLLTAWVSVHHFLWVGLPSPCPGLPLTLELSHAMSGGGYGWLVDFSLEQ